MSNIAIDKLRSRMGELLWEAVEEGIEIGVKLERERWVEAVNRIVTPRYALALLHDVLPEREADNE